MIASIDGQSADEKEWDSVCNSLQAIAPARLSDPLNPALVR